METLDETVLRLAQEVEAKSQELKAHVDLLSTLSRVILADNEKRILMREEYKGEVTLVTGDEVTVVYDNPYPNRKPRKITQIYKTSQFMPNGVPPTGTQLVAYVFITEANVRV